MPDFKDTRIRFRKGTESEWSSSNPILASGEPGYDLTNNLLKIGDGETNWSNLTGIAGGGGGSGLTQSQVVEIVNSGISGVVDGAPSLLNTLNELANALNDDEEFSTTVLNALADKADSSDIYNAAVEWTANHTLVDGTRYLAGDLVYVSGQIYKAKFDNESLPVTNTTYWMNVGSGYRLNIDGRDIQNIPYPVDTVNGQTGDVELSAGDIDDFHTTVSGLLPVKNIINGEGISISSVSGEFTISSTGSVSGVFVIPVTDVDLHNGGIQSAQVLQFDDTSKQSVITGPTPAENSNAQRLIIQGQRASGTYAEGGDVYLWGGDADYNGGDIKIYAGDADNISPDNGYGGYVNIDGGKGATEGGDVEITAGYSEAGQAGNVNIIGGPTATGIAGNVTIRTNNNNNIWSFRDNGNLDLPEGKILNFGQNVDTLGPPMSGGGTDRVRLWDFKGTGSNFNYAIGAEGNHVWFSMDVNDGTGGFKFYSRDTEIFKISDDSKLIFPNLTTIAQGTFDNSTGGNNGISLNCYVGYELNWQGGHLKSTQDGGITAANIYCDSPIEFQGSGIDNMEINSSGLIFPDGTTQSSANITSANITDFDSAVSGLLPVKDIVSGSNISVSSISGIFDISTSGVSLDGHGHTAANISDFNSSVSGLLPVKNITSGSGISVTSVSGIYTVSSIITSVDQAQSLVTTVFNSTGSPIPKLKAVYINGGQGDLPTIALASSNGEGTSSKTYAITYEQINHMSSGRVIVTGALTGVNTDQFNPTAPTGNVNGTTLWLSTSGNLTITKPSAPYHAVSLGTIVRTHQNAGVVEVKVQNGYELNELHNVKINGVANNDVLVYSSGSQLWESNSKVVFSDNTGITGASGIDNIVKISQAAYDNLSSYDPNTIYFVV